MPITEPVPIVEISSSLPGDIPVWVDVTSSFRSAKTKRGKLRQRDRSAAGTASFYFSNADRKFDPENAAGPLYAFLRPMRRIRLRATWDGTTYPIFDGYIDFIEQGYNGPHESTATIAATDGFKRLEAADLPGVWESVLSQELDVKAWFRLDEPIDESINLLYLYDRSNHGYTAFKTGPVVSVPGLLEDDPNLGMECPDTGLGGIGIPEPVTMQTLPWAIEFWLKAPRYDAGALSGIGYADVIRTNIYGTIGSPGTLTAFTRNAADGILVDQLSVIIGSKFGPSSSVIGTKPVFDNQPHHIVIVAEAGMPMKLYIDGALSVASTTGNSEPLARIAMAFGISVIKTTWDELRFYEGIIPDAATIANHYALGTNPWENDTPAQRINKLLDLIQWPVADRTLSAAGSPLQRTGLGGTALEHLLLIEETELGSVFMTADGSVRYIGRDELITGPFAASQATFGDDLGELGYTKLDGYRLSDDTVRNLIRRQREGGAEIVVFDESSRDSYGTKTESSSGTQETNNQASIDRANYRLAHVKDPSTYVSKMEIAPRKNAIDLFPVVLGVDLQSRITLKRRPQRVGDAIIQESMVQGIEHDLGPKMWRTRFNLDQTAAQRYFLFDITLWDAPDWRFSST